MCAVIFLMLLIFSLRLWAIVLGFCPTLGANFHNFNFVPIKFKSGAKWAIFDWSILEERSDWADFWHGIAWYFQLRVVRAFKSTLEDLEERLSVHSANSGRVLRGGRIPSDITYIDAEDPPQLHLQSGVKSRFLGPPRRAPRAETPI